MRGRLGDIKVAMSGLRSGAPAARRIKLGELQVRRVGGRGRQKHSLFRGVELEESEKRTRMEGRMEWMLGSAVEGRPRGGQGQGRRCHGQGVGQRQ